MSPFHSRQPNHFALPERIDRLGELSYNLWWTWSHAAHDLFERIDRILWAEVGHNPILFLRSVAAEKLAAAAQDLNYTDLYDATLAEFDAYMRSPALWFNQQHGEHAGAQIAYFSTEFGLHETLPMYAGGLGVLAGDHLKEASDLGLPMVALGFIYTEGYFFQHISEDGWQEARRVSLQFEDMPVMPVVDDDGMPLTVTVQLPGRSLQARVWLVQVGRVPLYLLDSNVASNSDSDRHLTARLYSSEMDLRISQEIVLGIGGVRALRSLGYQPTVWHMNEGHSAFLALEQARELVSNGLPLAAAVQQLRAHNVFTTHTPVPAGNDEFPLWLVDKYFAHFWPQLGLDQQGFVDLAGRLNNEQTVFSMPILALRFSAQHNGVSELHGRVARRMWNFLWPEVREDEVKIRYVTNGVHTPTWLARSMGDLFSQHLGLGWQVHVDDPAVWTGVRAIPDEALWAARRRLKRRMVAFVRERARQRWMHDGVHPVQTIAAGVLLDPYALTIGFARRFATYKRADLILSDLERLLRLLNQPEQPVQVVFAGKAHPADEGGKRLIQEVYRTVKKAEAGGRLVFLEDYDMQVARYLVQGVDVWLNTPRRPLEASGTSGQKAALNGALNFSVLDGWWREGYNGKNGWVIGQDEDIIDPHEQDASDAASLYDVLERQIVPLYYQDRLPDEAPEAWLAMVKESICTLAPQFSARRMLKDYVGDMYLPVIENPDQFLEG